MVETGDIEGLAEAVKNVINNPEKFKPEDCRRRAVENFDKNTQFNKYIDLYERVLRR